MKFTVGVPGASVMRRILSSAFFVAGSLPIGPHRTGRRAERAGSLPELTTTREGHGGRLHDRRLAEPLRRGRRRLGRPRRAAVRGRVDQPRPDPGARPAQPRGVLAAELLAVGVASWTILAVIKLRRLRGDDGQPTYARYLSVVLSQAASLPFVVAGASLIPRAGGGLYWLVPGIVFALLE